MPYVESWRPRPPERVIDGWQYFGYQPQEGQTDADLARGHAQVLRGEGFAQL